MEELAVKVLGVWKKHKSLWTRVLGESFTSKMRLKLTLEKQDMQRTKGRNTQNLVSKSSLLRGTTCWSHTLAWVFYSVLPGCYLPKVMAAKCQRQASWLCSYPLCQWPVLSGTGRLLQISLESLVAITQWKAYCNLCFRSISSVAVYKMDEKKGKIGIRNTCKVICCYYLICGRQGEVWR